jgi:predicted enzyme related to lactoylglutathione lyase
MAFSNAISWFEIGTSDLNRATKFYETIFGVTLTPLIWTILKCACFPYRI